MHTNWKGRRGDRGLGAGGGGPGKEGTMALRLAKKRKGDGVVGANAGERKR